MLNFKRFEFVAVTLVFLICLSGLCSAQTIENPALVKKLDAQIINYGTVSVASASLKWVKINMTIPQQRTYQTVDYEGQTLTDPLGNKLANIEEINPPNKIEYLVQSNVSVSSRKTTDIPKTYSIPDNVKVYLKPSENIQSNDSRINTLARHITENSKTDFEKISKLAIWAHDNIKYTETLGEETKDALWVLNNRIGTCDEFSSLFIALARSIDIPARYVSGYAHSEDEWQKHAWSEVYLGRWIPVDPTWLEIGSLDATHIDFGVHTDNIVENEIQAYGVKTDDINWLEDKTNVNTLSYTEEESVDYQLIGSSEIFEPGDRAVVVFKIDSKEYKVLDLILEPCEGAPTIVTIENKSKQVILEPKEKIAFWILEISGDLDENMIYTCPLTLNSKLLGIRTVNITVDPRDISKVMLTGELSKPVVNLGEEETVYLDVERTKGSGDIQIGFIAEDTLKTTEIGSDEYLTFSFKPTRIGEQKVYAYSSTGEVISLDYTVKETSDVFIEDIEAPDNLSVGNSSSLNITIKNNRATQQSLKLYIKINDFEQIKNIVVDKELTVSVPFLVEKTGINNISVNLKDSNVDETWLKKIIVYGPPEAKFDFIERMKTIVKNLIEKLSVFLIQFSS